MQQFKPVSPVLSLFQVLQVYSSACKCIITTRVFIIKVAVIVKHTGEIWCEDRWLVHGRLQMKTSATIIIIIIQVHVCAAGRRVILKKQVDN